MEESYINKNSDAANYRYRCQRHLQGFAYRLVKAKSFSMVSSEDKLVWYPGSPWFFIGLLDAVYFRFVARRSILRAKGVALLMKF